VIAGGLDPATIVVTALMQNPVVIVQESEDCAQVIERMSMHGVRRVPVVDGQGMVVGIVTLDDLLRMIVTHANALLNVMEKSAKAERHALR
jgi:predicted transcriptional regulator